MTPDKYNIPLKSYSHIYRVDKKSMIKYWFAGILLFLIIILFLPWTQNIKIKGSVTTLYQEQRPQEINSPIPGKIIKWWVKEGDFVKKGDTILKLAEIKEDYLDPNLLNRTKQQVSAKKGSLNYYQSKAKAIDAQIDALYNVRKLKEQQLINKIKQLDNKLLGEKAELSASLNEYKLAKDQYDRQQKMFNDGLVSQTQLEQRNIAFQNAMAKNIIVENKLAQTMQEITNVRIELNSVEQEYSEKISKAESEKFQSLSQIASGEAEVAKMENTFANYIIRNGMYIILAPQDGQIVQSKKAGIGEIVKDGEHITLIVPSRLNYAVELYARPIDLPLINLGQDVRFTFDGFPAIVFSGWPKNSYGTFSGKVVAFENSISPNGMFRVLVAEDSTIRKWPEQLKIGTGAQGIILIKDVPIWYELWRNINGFPPDFYTYNNKAEDKIKK